VISGTRAKSPQQVPLSATGTAPPTASVSPTSLSFGYVRVGSTSSSKTVTVTDSGGSALTINGVSRTGANPGNFVITSNTCRAGTRLSPGETCTIAVAARPRARGMRTATLRISNDAPDSPQSVALSANGY
jgi:Abnormal spindle-like microcephaly-assoc'd, ASPM-SPD-2-Hydin